MTFDEYELRRQAEEEFERAKQLFDEFKKKYGVPEKKSPLEGLPPIDELWKKTDPKAKDLDELLPEVPSLEELLKDKIKDKN